MNRMKRKLYLTLAAIIITFITLIIIKPTMKNRYEKTVRSEFQRTKDFKTELLTETDLNHVPEIVKKYIRHSGFVGKEKVFNFRSEFKGGIRSNPGENYMPLKSVQYNFIDMPSRSFYIVAKKKGISAVGLHLYHKAKATFQVRLLGLIPVVNAKGHEMDQGETVTVFNDMFFMAPGSLIDKRIEWEIIDSQTVKAFFSVNGIKVSAVLYFDNDGKLVNFISNDRFDTDGKDYVNYPWETPFSEYKDFNSYRLPSKAKVIYKRPNGDFCYGEFELLSIVYNCRSFK